MRTTVTVDPDLIRRLRELALRRGLPFKTILNEVIRRGLAAPETSRGRRGRFVVKPHSGGFRPGIDPTKLNQLLDQLDAEAFVAKASR